MVTLQRERTCKREGPKAARNPMRSAKGMVPRKMQNAKWELCKGSAARQGQSHQAIQCYGGRNQAPPPPPPPVHPPSTHVRRPIGSCSGSTQQMMKTEALYDLQNLILWHYELESYVFCESCFLCVYIVLMFSCSSIPQAPRALAESVSSGADARRIASDLRRIEYACRKDE